MANIPLSRKNAKDKRKDMARSRRRTINIALAFSLMLALVLSANSHTFPHEPIVLAEIVAQHTQEKAEHSHSHDAPESPSHAFYGHAHDAVDHDHNPVFLSPRDASARTPAVSARLFVAVTRSWRRPAFDLDKPPRG